MQTPMSFIEKICFYYYSNRSQNHKKTKNYSTLGIPIKSFQKKLTICIHNEMGNILKR